MVEDFKSLGCYLNSVVWIVLPEMILKHRSEEPGGVLYVGTWKNSNLERGNTLFIVLKCAVVYYFKEQKIYRMVGVKKGR